MVGETRARMHDVVHYDRYWFKDRCPDAGLREKIVESCPFGALVFDKNDPEEIHIHFDPCNMCMRCQKVAPEGALRIAPSTSSRSRKRAPSAPPSRWELSSLENGPSGTGNPHDPGMRLLWVYQHAILPDAGIFGSDDIVALDKAVLDVTARTSLIRENVPTSMEIQAVDAHPFAQLHGKYKDPYCVVRYGEKLGLGSQEYDLVDVLPVVDRGPEPMGYYISAT